MSSPCKAIRCIRPPQSLVHVTNICQVWILTTYGNGPLVHYPLNAKQFKEITTIFFTYKVETLCVPTTCVQSCLIQMSHSKVRVVETCDHNNHTNTRQVYPKYGLYLNQYDNNSLGSLYTVLHKCANTCEIHQPWEQDITQASLFPAGITLTSVTTVLGNTWLTISVCNLVSATVTVTVAADGSSFLGDTGTHSFSAILTVAWTTVPAAQHNGHLWKDLSH
jgi:hypothetical protein